jgi:membrane-associated protease RseP (regulator of RpoE activity)
VLHISLFAATFVTTSMAGAYSAGFDPLGDPASIRSGFPFSVTLLSILLFHEMGHYVLAKLHRVQVTLPYFIPAPPFFIVGTFGAFIRMKSPPPNRRALFDVGASGPWAGLLVSIPAVLIGLRLSWVGPMQEMQPMPSEEIVWFQFGGSLLFSFLEQIALGSLPEDATVVLHPIALAGWFGLFVTFLNLLPIGQLDGGHVAYAMFGAAHRWVARLFLLVIGTLGFMSFLGYEGWPGWLLWVALLLFIGIDHPPTMEAWAPLDRRRQIGSWLTVAAFVVTFVPQPITVSEPDPVFEGERVPVAVALERLPRATPRWVVPLHFKAEPRGIEI